MRVDFALEGNYLPIILSDDGQSLQITLYRAFTQGVLTEIVRTMISLWQGHPEIELTIYDYPQVYQWRFRLIAGQVEFQIHATDHDEIVWTSQLAVKTVCTAFWRGLRRWQSTAPEQAYAATWNEPFPTTEIERLTQLLKTKD